MANIAKPAWRIQTLFDLARHEGFRPWPYPDPLSRIGRLYGSAKYRWGFKPPRLILAELGLDAKDGKPWTNGFGETYNITPDTPEVSREYSMKHLENRLMEHVVGLDKLVPGWRSKYPVVVQTVLANLIYNLGQERLGKFVNTLNLIRTGQYKEAADNLVKSAWHKQVGERALELEQRLRTGRIEPKHLVIALKDDYEVKPDFTNVEGRVTSTEEFKKE